MCAIRRTIIQRQRFPARHYASGYTLLELLVTVAIAGILVALAVPGFQDTIERNARESAMLDMVSSLAFARAEAVTQGRSVSICRLNPTPVVPGGIECHESDGGNWAAGWVVFTDGATRGKVDGTDAVLRVNAELPEQIVITLNNDDDSDITGDFLSFTTDGFLDNASTSAQVYFKLCALDADSSISRAIWVAATGRPTMSVADADGVHDDVLGADLVCP